MIKVMPLTYDFVFKAIFSAEVNKEITMFFLESILEIEIRNMRVLNTELLKGKKDEKLGFLDVLLKLVDGTTVGIELQIVKQSFYKSRNEFYTSKIYLSQYKHGSKYIDAKKIISINILDFIEYQRDTYHTVSKLRLEDIDEGKRVGYISKKEDVFQNDQREVHTLELPKFRNKKVVNMDSNLEQWLSFIELTRKGEIDMDQIKKYDERIQKVAKILEEMALDPVERMHKERELKKLEDTKYAIMYAEDQAKALGQALGQAQGELNSKINMAKLLLKESMSIESIMRVTGLSKEELDKVS